MTSCAITVACFAAGAIIGCLLMIAWLLKRLE